MFGGHIEQCSGITPDLVLGVTPGSAWENNAMPGIEPGPHVYRACVPPHRALSLSNTW